MWSGIALFYFACLALGFLFALLGAVFGELFGHGGIEAGAHDAEVGQPDHGFDVGHADHEFEAGGHGEVIAGDHGDMAGASVFNTITMATFVGFFGISGLIGVWGFGLGPLASLAFAMPTSIIIAAAEFLLYVKVFVKAQASSEATLAEVLGCEAEVITTIPADRVGEIAYVIRGSRYTAPAASADAEEIPRGTRVNVVNIRGTTLMVRPL